MISSSSGSVQGLSEPDSLQEAGTPTPAAKCVSLKKKKQQIDRQKQRILWSLNETFKLVAGAKSETWEGADGAACGSPRPSGESRRPPKAPRGAGGVLADRRQLTSAARLATALAVSLGGSANLTGSLSTGHDGLSTCVHRQTKGATRLWLLPRPPSPSSLC